MEGLARDLFPPFPTKNQGEIRRDQLAVDGASSFRRAVHREGRRQPGGDDGESMAP